jgi:hypothetical protein
MNEVQIKLLPVSVFGFSCLSFQSSSSEYLTFRDINQQSMSKMMATRDADQSDVKS